MSKITIIDKKMCRLKKVFDFLYVATAKDEIKPTFTGFYFDADKIVTTDGRRLHIATAEDFKIYSSLVFLKLKKQGVNT